MKKFNKTISIALSAMLVTFTLTGCDFMGTVNTDLTLKDENEAVAQISQSTPVNNPDIITDPGTNTNPDINTNPDNTDPYNPDDITVIDDRDPLDIYMSFLEGKDKAYIDLYPDYFEDDVQYEYSEIIDGFNSYLQESWGDDTMKIMEVDYAIIDCGNDGFPELCLRLISNNQNGYDEMNDYFTIVAFDWGLSFQDHYNTYYRSMGEMNKYGIFHTYGSSGANRGYDSYERVNKYGEHEFIYDCSSELSIAEPIINYYSIPSDIDLPADYPTDLDYGKINKYAFGFMEYTMDMYDNKELEDEYYRHHAYLFNDDYGNVYFPEEKYEKIYEKAGLIVTDGDGINELISQRLEELGISEDEMITVWEDETAEPEWEVWEDFCT
ncbi:MAG: hypothetical protein IKS56_07210 [Lachnospiraceae bacterium]|nr:hypothetical protein [Lachnospiraceae bacterium]